MSLPSWSAFLSLCCIFWGAHPLTLNRIIGDNMVLQRGPARSRVFGWADPSEPIITAQIDQGKLYSTPRSIDGSWLIELDPQEASDGHTITFSSNTDSIVIKNVAFGEVYLCSGQSNMQFIVSMTYTAVEDIADSKNYPSMSLFVIAANSSTTPLTNYSTPYPDHQFWKRSSPEAVGSTADWTYFSAVCFGVGRLMYQSLNGTVPIGLLDISWGGSYIEAWLPPSGFRLCEDYTYPTPGFPTNNGGDVLPQLPNSGIYNGMIHPILPFVFSVMLWYQGESNRNEFGLSQYPYDRMKAYQCQQSALILTYRKLFQHNFDFYFVQLAPVKASDELPLMRDDQLYAISVGGVDYAVAYDIGDPTSPYGPFHPRNKREVARRLSLALLKSSYHQDVVSHGPVVTSIVPSPDGRSAMVYLAADKSASGMFFFNTEGCTTCCQDLPFVFEVDQGGGNKVFVRAEILDVKHFDPSSFFSTSSSTLTPSPTPSPSSSIYSTIISFVHNLSPSFFSIFSSGTPPDAPGSRSQIASTLSETSTPYIQIRIPANTFGVMMGILYSYEDVPQCALYNFQKLPSTPFFYDVRAKRFRSYRK